MTSSLPTLHPSDRTTIIFDGKSPNRLACDTTLRRMPDGWLNYRDGFVSDDRQRLHFAFNDNRHRAVYYGAKLPPPPHGRKNSH